MEKYHPSDGLETLDETQNTQENGIDDGVIVGTNINTGSDTTAGGDNGFLGRILRVLGMDTSKIGALAVNGIIFIAQMVSESESFQACTAYGQKIFIYLPFFISIGVK